MAARSSSALCLELCSAKPACFVRLRNRYPVLRSMQAYSNFSLLSSVFRFLDSGPSATDTRIPRMSDEARVIGASYGVTEGLDAPLKGELAHKSRIRELLKCPQDALRTRRFLFENRAIRWDEVNYCSPAAPPDIFIAREPSALHCRPPIKRVQDELCRHALRGGPAAHGAEALD